MVNIIIGSDVCPIGRNRAYFTRGDAAGIFGDLLDEFAAADLRVVNLECPLIENEAPILKSGPILGASSECVNGLKNTHIDVIGMANNHILDHGEQGLRNTIKVCREAGMRVVGAGENLADAREILSLQVKDIRVGKACRVDSGDGCIRAGTEGGEPATTEVPTPEYCSWAPTN